MIVYKENLKLKNEIAKLQKEIYLKKALDQHLKKGNAINRYVSQTQYNKIILCFVEDITATATAKIVGVNRNTVNRYFNIIREKIFKESLKETEKEIGTFELDKSYFGAKRVRGKRGRGAAGKTPIFGLLKRDEKVFTQIVQNCSKKALMPIIKGHILDGSTVNTDRWKAY